MCRLYSGILASCGLALFLGATSSLAAPAVNVATAPDARSVAIGTAATIFVEFVNSGADAATGCSIAKPSGVPIDLSYQTLDAGGAVSGAADTPADIPAGASQRFLVTFTPTAAFEGRVHLRYTCTNFTPFVFEDVNDLFLTASAGDPPDLIAIFSTPSGDGVMRVNAVGGAQAAGGAVVNIGSAGGSATVDVTPTFGAFDGGIGVILNICETDPATGACMASPSPSIQMTVGGVAKTFSVFASANAGIGAPLFPEYIRVSVVFSDPAAAPDAPEGGGVTGMAAINGSIRGRGSVAFTAPATTIANPDISIFAGEYKLRMRDLQFDPNSDFISTGTLNIGSNGEATGIYHRFNTTDGNGNFVGEVNQVFRLEGAFDPAALTFAGEMIFVPDVLRNTPALRGNFVANFDPGRSVRGTYSFTAGADKPEKAQAQGTPSRPQTIPTESTNIQATGMHWLAIQNCAIVRNIPSSKLFDIYLDGVKIGTATMTRNSTSPSDFSFSGSITAAEGTFDISGNLVTPDDQINPFEALDGSRPLVANTLRIKESGGAKNTVLSDELNVKNLGMTNGTLVTDCTATGFMVEFYQRATSANNDNSKSLVLEFRMP
jgi:hypothetical protein